MATKFPNACSQYGTSMGRRDNMTETSYPVKFHLERVRLDSGGYDNGGAYWGNGAPLYYAYGDGAEERQEVFFRAYNRDDAKKQLRAAYPKCSFYR